jgi:hypothetical protein
MSNFNSYYHCYVKAPVGPATYALPFQVVFEPPQKIGFIETAGNKNRL